jgi:GT2 family glycosyltransferase
MTAADLLFAIVGAILALAALYLLVPAVAALFYRAREPHVSGDAHVVVLIPAHDEEGSIAQCVRGFEAQTYPAEWFDVVVIADNCTDDTARVAREAGAEVLVRDEPDLRGKGQALRWAIERVLARETSPAAVVVVDADTTADPNLLAGLVDRLERGAEAVQGESLLVDDGSPEQALRAAAFLLVNRTKPSGRSVLGLAVALQGNGMLFSRRVLTDHPWTAFSSTEDVEYGLALRVAGVEPAFARGAIAWSPVAPRGRAAEAQQLRWEGGKLHLARTLGPRLAAQALRERRPALLETAVDLAVPPLGYLAAAAASVTAAGAVHAWLDGLAAWAVTPAAVSLAEIPVYVLIGLIAADAPATAYRGLARAPWFVVRKVLRAHRLLRFRPDSWVRTERR